MELVQRIRADPILFAKYVCVCVCVCVCSCKRELPHTHRYQHSSQLIQALNRFVIHDAEMPDSWEKKLNKEGRVSG